ncbi:MAG: TRAP transporter small permease [Qingshengfaniella sp.]
MPRLITAIEMIAGLFLGLIALLTVTEAVMRYALGMRVPDAYAFATALQGIAIAWGIACTTWMRRHITVDAFWELAPPRVQAAMNVFASAVTFVAMSMLMGMLWRKTGQSMVSGEVSNDLMWPLWPVVMATTLGIAAAALLGLMRLIRDILEIRTL